MARNQFDEQLTELRQEILKLGTLLEETIQGTIHALVNRDAELATKIAKGDDVIDDQVKKIEHICYGLLLRQQPIAKDLREVSTALRMMTDMERIGDHGVDISELTLLLTEQEYPPEIHLIEKMAKEAMVMLLEAVAAFAGRDMEKAQGVIARDDMVDEMFLEFKNVVAVSICREQNCAEQILDLFMVAKYFERIGDHATNVAEWVIFSITGEEV